MNNVTRNDVWELAKSRRNDLVKLASDLIRIPSENPVGTQRDVIDFVEKYLSDAGISYEEVSCNPDHPNVTDMWMLSLPAIALSGIMIHLVAKLQTRESLAAALLI